MILNETPVRTSKNFNANDIEIKSIKVPDNVNSFLNRSIYINSDKKTLLVAENDEDSNRLNDLYEDSKVLVSELTKDDFKVKFGVGEDVVKNCQSNTNQPIRIVAKENSNLVEANIEFLFDDDNKELLDTIELYAERNANLNVIINYIPREISEEFSEKEKNKQEDESILLESVNNSTEKYFHSGIIKVCGLENSKINITLVNMLNNSSTNFINVENKLLDNCELYFNIVDFGGKHSITNYFTDLFGKCSSNNLNTIYLGNNSQLFDLNYIAFCRGEKTNINIEVQGALKDEAIKHFKGTIDFKKGCKKAIGNENENCLLLSDKAKSLALPMLLCSEEDVEGNHSSSSGKAEPKELFYLMSRGISEKDAMKLLVRAKFNSIIDSFTNNEIKELIISAIDSKL